VTEVGEHDLFFKFASDRAVWRFRTWRGESFKPVAAGSVDFAAVSGVPVGERILLEL